MHKTGSTSIQKSLNKFVNKEFMYANICNTSNHSVAIFSMFSGAPERHHLNASRLSDPSIMKSFLHTAKTDLEKSIKSSEHRTLILSGEDIGRLEKSELKIMRERLEEYYDRIQIIGYVRPPKSYMTSALQQMIRSGGRSRFKLHQVYPDYRSRFSKFDEVFGCNQVILKLFDRNSLIGGDSVVDFCSTLGLDLPRERIVHENESWSRQQICLMFQHNCFCKARAIEPMKGPEARKIMSQLHGLGNDRFCLSPRLLNAIVHVNRKDVRWMESRLGVPLDEPDADEEEGDISSKKDLLKSVPGAHDVLIEAIGRVGIRISANGPSDVELLQQLRLARSNKSLLQQVRSASWQFTKLLLSRVDKDS